MSQQGNSFSYNLPGDAEYQARLFPPFDELKLKLKQKFCNTRGLILHFTGRSLNTSQIKAYNLQVAPNTDGTYHISFSVPASQATDAQAFVDTQLTMLDVHHAGQAMKGVDAMKGTPAWNPMAGYPVSKHSGPSKWHMYLPLGMPLVNQRAVTLLHYPPYMAMTNADYLHNMTLERFQRVLTHAGIPEKDHWLYATIVDVNPVAAPGSGESEYPNDYFPIMMASQFFDNKDTGGDYIRSMLELLLSPPTHPADSKYTLPLLVGGSALYDPQAPGWFRTRYPQACVRKEAEPPIPTVDILQTGTIRIRPESERETPFMFVNHMIAAGVTGRCTSDASRMPDIRLYEAQDMAAGSFLKAYHDDPDADPEQVKTAACERWFGNGSGTGPPKPASEEDQQILCAMAQMDRFFNPDPPSSMFTWPEAMARCANCSDGQQLDACCDRCKPKGEEITTIIPPYRKPY